MTIVFAVETFDEIIDDIRPLIPRHWEELALYQDSVPLNPHFDLYKTMADAGRMVLFSARLDAALVGYAIYVVFDHLHYQGTLTALSDLFWVAPEHRRFGIGNGLFAFIEEVLTERGVKVMHTTLKLHEPAAAVLLEARGHAKVEVAFSKRLS